MLYVEHGHFGHIQNNVRRYAPIFVLKSNFIYSFARQIPFVKTRGFEKFYPPLTFDPYEANLQNFDFQQLVDIAR